MHLTSIKYVAGGLFLGIMITVGVGFGWLGWVLESKAERIAHNAVIEKLVPICVAQFREDPARKRKQDELEDIGYAQQSAYIEQQGWATMPGADQPNGDVADACVRAIAYSSV